MPETLLRPFLENPSRAGVFLDFDGTLSEIVRIPSEARPVEGAVDLLADLARRYAVVAIVSGRAAPQLMDWLGPEVEIWGVHGAERALKGHVELSELAAPYRSLMQKVHEEAAQRVARLRLEGAIVEDKGVMVTLHYRAADDLERARAAMESLASDLAARYDLTRVAGRASFELRPPMEFSKAAVVRERGKGLDAVAFFGDDVVDLPGFDALDELAAAGAAALRVAVRSDEAPPELIERADVVVEGPLGALEVLRRLAD
ncbi:MAG: trehalose-phosphatase [Actinomycetota bacterium]|nr:trehalose-phosphatase [Actinomycetota bacterium]